LQIDEAGRDNLSRILDRSGFISDLTFRIAQQADAFDAPVIFIDTDVPVLLGREGFFDHYRVKFEQDHDMFEIAAAPTS
jgi:hypothetical protein